MSNFDKMAEFAADLFLQQNQKNLLARYPLEADDDYLHITFLGDAFLIDRATGEVLISADDNPVHAAPGQALIVMDMVCNPIGSPIRTGSWITLEEASGAASNPQTSSLLDTYIKAYAGNTERLRSACDAIGAHPCPGGDVSYLIDIFDDYPIWMQFWDSDEEFPAQMKFLWDSSVRLHLHFETMWYILFEVLRKLDAQSS